MYRYLFTGQKNRHMLKNLKRLPVFFFSKCKLIEILNLRRIGVEKDRSASRNGLVKIYVFDSCLWKNGVTILHG